MEQKASCFAGSAGNGVKFKNFKSWCSEQQSKNLPLDHLWLRLGLKCPCRASFLEFPILPCSLPFIPQPELSLSIWAFHPFSLEEVRKAQGTRVILLSSRGSKCSDVSSIWFILCNSCVVFFKGLAVATISCGIFFSKNTKLSAN